MAEALRILAVAGSLRAESYNRKLLRIGVKILQEAGAEVDVLDLREVPLPLMDEDLEDREGLPPGAVEIKRRLGQAQGFLISSPEYNSSIPGIFKNAIDWATRGEGSVFEGKVGALMAASPGRWGGLRMMPHLRQVLTVLGVWLTPSQINLVKAGDAFKEDGSLVSTFYAGQVQDLVTELLTELRRRYPA